jgi:hypothetical protein
MNPALLLIAIDLAETDPRYETKVTLIVGGLLVFGFITNEYQYLTHLANAKHLEAPLRRSPSSAARATFIHLRDASYYQPGEKPNVGNIGSYTRVPLNAVIGFCLGSEIRVDMLASSIDRHATAQD